MCGDVALDGLVALKPALEGEGCRFKARSAAAAAVEVAAHGTAMRLAIELVNDGRLADAEHVARSRLRVQPSNVAALCLLSDLAARAGIYSEAERLLRAALSIEPWFDEAQLQLAGLLALRDGVAEAINLLDDVLTDFPDRYAIALKRARLLAQVGRYDDALRAMITLAKQHPDRPAVLIALANLQATIGDLSSSQANFRAAIEIEAENGDAWWGLANLKTQSLAPADIVTIDKVLTKSDLSSDRRASLLFALATARESLGDDAGALSDYSQGNALRRASVDYDHRRTTAEVTRSIDFFTLDRFAALAGAGDPSDEPIFITGMPRSGSTLIEQILASHSQIEGTSELPYIPMLVHRLLAERWHERTLRYPDVLDALQPSRFTSLAQIYLSAAKQHRHCTKRRFIDKLPNNWLYVGFIRLLFPNAIIVDTRRSAADCCWSNYRQWYAAGQEFSYDPNDLTRYYSDYIRHSDHMRRVLPGGIIQTSHEALIADPAKEIATLLAAVGVPFEAACLKPHENNRAVRTASAQQVRKPIGEHIRSKRRALAFHAPLLDDAFKRCGDCQL